MSFPASFPELPPLVIFSTDIFHPLITPLTTHKYTAHIHDNGKLGAINDEILPPGGFSLRHGFIKWFERKTVVSDEDTSASSQAQKSASTEEAQQVVTPSYMQTNTKRVSVFDVLKYIKSTFVRDEVLDSISLDAAGNSGAWYAWRTHRKRLGKLKDVQAIPKTRGSADFDDKVPGATTPQTDQTTSRTSRPPEEWNWDGVWEDRVKKGIAASLSEPALYGSGSTTDDLVGSPYLPE